MRKAAFCQVFVSALLLVACTITSASAQQTSFTRIQLPHGISIEVPSHWRVLPQDTRQNLAVASEALANNAGADRPQGKKATLLSVNATPNPVGAMIRLSVTSPPDYTQGDLAGATSGDLKPIGDELLNQFKRLEAVGGPRIVEMQPVRVEKFNGRLALIMSYVREDAKGPSPWQVTQYKIPLSNMLLEITLSHRQADDIVWKPTLEKVRRSVRF